MSLCNIDHNLAAGLGPCWSKEIERALMETQYNYHASAQFHRHDRSFVTLEHGVPRLIHFSAPPEFGGEPGVWTPEHFLLASVASCY